MSVNLLRYIILIKCLIEGCEVQDSGRNDGFGLGVVGGSIAFVWRQSAVKQTENSKSSRLDVDTLRPDFELRDSKAWTDYNLMLRWIEYKVRSQLQCSKLRITCISRDNWEIWWRHNANLTWESQLWCKDFLNYLTSLVEEFMPSNSLFWVVAYWVSNRTRKLCSHAIQFSSEAFGLVGALSNMILISTSRLGNNKKEELILYSGIPRALTVEMTSPRAVIFWAMLIMWCYDQSCLFQESFIKIDVPSKD